MPRVTFPNGDSIEFPEGTDQQTIQRVSADHWEQASQKVDATGLTPPEPGPEPVEPNPNALPMMRSSGQQGPDLIPSHIPNFVEARTPGPQRMEVSPEQRQSPQKTLQNAPGSFEALDGADGASGVPGPSATNLTPGTPTIGANPDAVPMSDVGWDAVAPLAVPGIDPGAGLWSLLGRTEFGKGMASMGPQVAAAIPETIAAAVDAQASAPWVPQKTTDTMRGMVSDPLYGASDTVAAISQIVPPAAVQRIEDIHGLADFGDWLASQLGQQTMVLPGIAASTAAGGPAGGLTAATILQTGMQSRELREMGESDPGKAVSVGLVTGAMEFLPVGRLLSRTKIAGPGFKKWAVEKLKHMGQQSVEESLTEGLQTFTEKLGLQWANENYDAFTPETWSEIMNAMAAGGAVGGVMGAGGSVQRTQDQAPQEPVRPEAPPQQPGAAETPPPARRGFPPRRQGVQEPPPWRGREPIPAEGDRRAADRGTPDRRMDLTQRRRVSEMTEEEAKYELLVDHKLRETTGVEISNDRAYFEAEADTPDGVTVWGDVDGLGWWNDNASEATGNELLGIFAEEWKATRDEMPDAVRAVSRIGGDEFAGRLVRGGEERFAARLQERLAGRELDVTLKDGTPVRGKIAGSFGVGRNYDEASVSGHTEKERRESQGLRSAKGREPVGLVRETQTDGQPPGVDQGSTPQEVTPAPPTGKKSPWQQTKAEYIDSVDGWAGAARDHKNFIKKALEQGQPVPPEVLKDYPDLAPAAAAAPAEPPPAAPVELVEPAATPETPPTQASSTALKQAKQLRNQAAKIRAKAEEKKGQDRQTHTPRMAKHAAQAIEDANAELAIAETMEKVAELIESGRDSKLAGIKSRAALESLERVLRIGKFKIDRKNDTPWDESRHRPATAEDAEAAVYPWPRSDSDISRSVARDLEKVQGGKNLAKRWEKIANSGDGKPITDLKLLQDTEKKLGKNWRYADDLADVKRLRSLGINEVSELREALKDLVEIRAQKKGIDKSTAAELSLAGRKIPGFFPTPPAVIERMLEAADIQPTDKVLEPSAGKGDIAQGLLEAGVESVDAIEINNDLREILKGTNGVNIVGGDFLNFQRGQEGEYDKIVMNPPFENGQDMDHVKHAFKRLKPGGRIVAIMSEGSFSRGDKKATGFREWLEEVGGTSEKLPAGSFMEHKLRKTGTATRLVVIDKPGEAVAAAPEPTKEPWEMTREEFYRWQDNQPSDMTEAQSLALEYTDLVKGHLRNQKGSGKAWLSFEEMAKDLQDPDGTTYWEIIQAGGEPYQRKTHEEYIEQALAAGKPVPPEVLADYPDLKPEPTESKAPTKPDLDAEPTPDAVTNLEESGVAVDEKPPASDERVLEIASDRPDWHEKGVGHSDSTGLSKAQKVWIREKLEKHFSEIDQSFDKKPEKEVIRLMVPDDGIFTLDDHSALRLYATLATGSDSKVLNKEAAFEYFGGKKVDTFSKAGNPRVKMTYTAPRIPKPGQPNYDVKRGFGTTEKSQSVKAEDKNVVTDGASLILKNMLAKKLRAPVQNQLKVDQEAKKVSKSTTDKIIAMAKGLKDKIEVESYDYADPYQSETPNVFLQTVGKDPIQQTLDYHRLQFMLEATGADEMRINLDDETSPVGFFRGGKLAGFLMPIKIKASEQARAGKLTGKGDKSKTEITYIHGKGASDFTADPVEEVEVEAGGEGGFIDLFAASKGRTRKVAKPALTEEKIRGGDEEVESFFERTARLRSPAGSFRELMVKLKVGLKEQFLYLPKIERTADTAFARERLRHIEDVPGVAKENAARDVHRYIAGLGDRRHIDRAGLELLRRKIFMEDMKVEALRAVEEAERYLAENPEPSKEKAEEIARGRTPLKLEQISAELDRINPLVDATPSVRDAYALRTNLWDRVTNGLVERGVLPDTVLENPHYVRHFVLKYIEENRAQGGAGKRLNEPVRKYAKRRKGTTSDWSTDLLEVEARALYDIYRDNLIQDIGEEVAGWYDEAPALKSLAKRRNYEGIVGGPDNLRTLESLRGQKAALLEKKEQIGWEQEDRDRMGEINQLIWQLDPTMPFRVKISMGLERIREAWGLDGEEAADVYHNMLEEEGIEGFGEDVFGRLAELVRDENEEVRIGALTVLKGINERKQFIRKTLGKDFVTPEKLANEKGLVPWQFKRGNIMYRAKTVAESDIAKLQKQLVDEAGEEIAAELQIPESMLRDAMVLGGKRKQFFVPDWLAAQLDDLPVNQRRGAIVSVTVPVTQYWKKWILNTNPIRYNLRNFMGDAEATFAARGAGPFKKIPEAFRILAEKKDVVYEKAKEFGVVGTAMGFEFGDVRKIEEFELFRDVENIDSVRSAMKALWLRLGRGAQAMQDVTQFREDILRLAVFLDAVDKVKAGNYSHVAGRIGGKVDIERLAKDHGDDGKYMAAARVSRETVGDYGKFTPWEDRVLRQGLLPFYSWLKINTTRWPRILINTWKEGEGRGRAAGAAFAYSAGRTAGLLARILPVYAALALWNNRDDEARKHERALLKSQPWLRNYPHLTLPGGVVSTPSALSDFAEWFDIEDIAHIMARYERGQITFQQMIGDLLVQQAGQVLNRVVQGMNPFLKAGTRVVFGQDLFPEVTQPRNFYDAWTDKAYANAALSVLGSDAKRFLDAANGKRTVEEVLAYYFSGSSYRPMTEEQLQERLLLSFAWASLKRPSKVTGRKRGEAKSGKEDEWHEALEGLRALGLKDDEIYAKIREMGE